MPVVRLVCARLANVRTHRSRALELQARTLPGRVAPLHRWLELLAAASRLFSSPSAIVPATRPERQSQTPGPSVAIVESMFILAYAASPFRAARTSDGVGTRARVEAEAGPKGAHRSSRRAIESGHQDSGMPRDDDVTGLLVAWGQGDRAADSRLMAVVYEDLRRVARRRLRAERVDHSLAPTALVHEAYLRLVDVRRVRWQNRAHFFAIAARSCARSWWTMRARTGPPNGVAPAGGCCWRTIVGATMPRDVHLLDLDAALGKLAAIDARLGDLVVLRFFGGLTVEEAAEVLGLSPATVKRDWTRARACLFRELRSVDPRARSRNDSLVSETPYGAVARERGLGCDTHRRDRSDGC